MGGKRKKSDGEEGCEDEPLAKKEKTKKKEILPSMIKDKDKRSEVHAKLKHQKKLEKRKRAKARAAVVKRALELGEEPPAPKIPRTIENTREFDETVCMPDDEEGGPAFISEPLSVIPNAHYYKRGTYDLKKIVTYAYNKEFVSIIVVHTNRREPDALIIMNLPNGPTAHFNLSKLVLRKDIKIHFGDKRN